MFKGYLIHIFLDCNREQCGKEESNNWFIYREMQETMKNKRERLIKAKNMEREKK